MKTRKNLGWLLWLMFFSWITLPLHAQSPESRSLQLQYNSSESCSSLTMTYFFASRHAKGDRNGLLNQRNGGFGGVCFHDKDRTFYTLMGGLENSQFRSTFVYGPGIRFRSPQFMRFGVEGGFELPFVHYELRYGRGYVYGFLPVQYLSIAYELPNFAGMKLGTIGLGERQFGQNKERVKLYAIEWRKNF